MEVYLKRIELYEDTISYAFGDEIEERIAAFKKLMEEYINNISEVVDTDFNTLSGMELYLLLKKVYLIDFELKDCLYVLSRKNNKKYHKAARIYTQKTFSYKSYSGKGKDLECKNNLAQIYFDIAITDDVKIESRSYSKEEIKKMFDSNDIAILSSNTREISDAKYIDRVDYYQEEDDGFYYNHNFNESIIFDNDKILGELLRKTFSKERIRRSMLRQLNIIQKELKEIYEYIDHNDYSYDERKEIAQACKTWYDSSTEKKEYKRIKEKLNNKE